MCARYASKCISYIFHISYISLDVMRLQSTIAPTIYITVASGGLSPHQLFDHTMIDSIYFWST
jgi:hypothetical protein